MAKKVQSLAEWWKDMAEFLKDAASNEWTFWKPKDDKRVQEITELIKAKED